MTPVAWFLAILAAASAGADWNAVARAQKRALYVFKPLTLIALIGVALALEPRSETQRDFFVAALLLGLAGDVFLMLSDRWFIPGLVSFLVGHLLYIAGFLAAGGLHRLGPEQILIVFVAAAVLGQVVGRTVRRQPALALAIFVYGAALAGMAASALANGRPAAGAGAILFLVSDSILGWNRFVRPLRWAPLAIIVTYHAAQAGLVLSLAT